MHTQLRFVVRLCRRLGSADEQIRWFAVLLGLCRANLVSRDLSASCCTPFPASLLQSHSPGSSRTESLWYPVEQNQSRGPHEATHSVGCRAGEEKPWALFFRWRKHVLRADVGRCAAPAGARRVRSAGCSPCPSRAVCLALCAAGECFVLTPEF